MISVVDCAIVIVVTLSIGVLVGGFNRVAERARPENEHQSAAQNAGLLRPYIPQREVERVPVPRCLRHHAAMYALRFRN